MSDFTPGKWKVVHGAGTDEFDVFSEDAPLHNFICVLFGYPVSRWGEQEANARLIAAAPEMYALLEECADELGAIGLPTLSRECYDLLSRIDDKEGQL